MGRIEERTTKIKKRANKNTQSKQERENISKKYEKSLRKLWNNNKISNIDVIGVPEGKRTGLKVF